MKRGSLKLSLGAVLLLAGSGPAFAYVRSSTQAGAPTAWGNAHLQVEVYTAEAPQFLEPGTLLEATRAATARWSQPAVTCTEITFNVVDMPEAFAPADFDRRNRIGFRRGNAREDWRKIPCVPTAKQNCSPYPTGAIAITTVTSNSNTGEILDADMEINAVNQKFADLGPSGTLRPDLVKVHDLENTLTHEIGHLLGFDHNCYDPAANLRGVPNDHLGRAAPRCGDMSPAEIRAATMYNQAFEREVTKRDLDTDDLLAVCETYPLGYRGRFGSPEEDETGCSFAPRPPVDQGGLGFLALVSLGTWTWGAFRVSRRRRR